MARPRKKVDPELIKSLASINCTMPEIASITGVSIDTLERRFAAIIKEGRDHGKMSLRREMWKAVKERGNVTMMIWLSKQLLGYTDKVTQTVGLVTPEDGAKEDLENAIKTHLERREREAKSKDPV